MATDSFKIKKGLNIEPNAAPNLSTDGDIGFNSTDSNLEVYTGGSVKKVITNSQTQTLTNKTLTGNTAANLISGSGTTTFNTSGTVTIPNTTDTLVGRNTTDTLTNKTIDAGSNTLVGVLSNPMTTGGDIIYGGASGTPTRLANGSAGAALVSAGGTSAPTWGSILASGTYTPTLTAITNVASLTASNATRYLRVGNVVMVSGQCDMDPTAGSGLFVFDISLPIASNFTSQAQLTGTCGTDGAGSDIGAGVNYIRANTTDDRARVTGILTTALHGSNQTYFTFSYEIL